MQQTNRIYHRIRHSIFNHDFATTKDLKIEVKLNRSIPTVTKATCSIEKITIDRSIGEKSFMCCFTGNQSYVNHPPV